MCYSIRSSWGPGDEASAIELHAGRVRVSVVFLSLFLLYHTNFDIGNGNIGQNSTIPGITVSQSTAWHNNYSNIAVLALNSLVVEYFSLKDNCEVEKVFCRVLWPCKYWPSRK